MNADRLIDVLMRKFNVIGASKDVKAICWLAISLLNEAPGVHHGSCPRRWGYEHMRCRCDYEEFQTAIETATRELCGGEDAQKG